jgi:hypothetical protein
MWPALAFGEIVALAIACGFAGYAVYESEALLFLRLTPASPSHILKRLPKLLWPHIEETFVTILALAAGLAAGAMFASRTAPCPWAPAVGLPGAVAVVLAGSLGATVLLWATAVLLVIAGGRTPWRWCASCARASGPFQMLLSAFLPALVTGFAVWVRALPPLLPVPLAWMIFLVLPVHWPLGAVLSRLTDGGSTPQPHVLVMALTCAAGCLAALALARRRLAECPSEEDLRPRDRKPGRLGPRPAPAHRLVAFLVPPGLRMVARLTGQDPCRFMAYVPVCLGWELLALVAMGGFVVVHGPASASLPGGVLASMSGFVPICVGMLAVMLVGLVSLAPGSIAAWPAHMRLGRPRWYPAWALYPVSAWRCMRLATAYELVKWLLIGLPVCVIGTLGFHLAGVLKGSIWINMALAAFGLASLMVVGPIFSVGPYVSIARWRASPSPLFKRFPLLCLEALLAVALLALALIATIVSSVDIALWGLLLVLAMAWAACFVLSGFIDGRRGLDVCGMSFERSGTDFDVR